MSRIDFATLQAFSERCLAAASPVEITEPLDAMMQSQNVRQWFVGSLGYINQWRGFGFDSIPPEWRRRYIEAGHAAYDPVYAHAAAGGPKTTWARCRRLALESGDKRAIVVLDEAAEFGLTDGLIMPIHGFGDLPAAVSFGGDDLDMSDDAQASLYLIGALAYEGLRRLVVPFRPVPPVLTEKELRVLRWTAEGKSAEAIAVIVRLSPHTVREHHERIRRKYGVTTMIQAVVHAALDGNLRRASHMAS